MAHRPRVALLALAALGMTLSALPHALGAWPHFRGALVGLGADARTLGAVGSAWAFGTTMMLVCAAIVAGQAHRAARDEAVVRSTLWPIALGWMGYGTAAFVVRDFNTHYLGFAACGAILLLAVVLPVRR